jgi:hypothetical protein
MEDRYTVLILLLSMFFLPFCCIFLVIFSCKRWNECADRKVTINNLKKQRKNKIFNNINSFQKINYQSKIMISSFTTSKDELIESKIYIKTEINNSII